MHTLPARRLFGAALLTTVGLAAPAMTAVTATPALAGGAASGCVSNADYAKLANGQRVAYVRRVAGDDAQISMRRWNSSNNRYQERLYAMCTPTDSAHDTLTTRFMWYRHAWRAFVVDTHIGPE